MRIAYSGVATIAYDFQLAGNALLGGGCQVRDSLELISGQVLMSFLMDNEVISRAMIAGKILAYFTACCCWLNVTL